MNTAVATSTHDLRRHPGGHAWRHPCLPGGRRGIRSVLVRTLLIGILLNGLTILNIEYTLQVAVGA